MATTDTQTIEFNPEFRQALHLMEETDTNVFVTGRAGTGKSTLLRYFRDTTEKALVILAPTGVAAVNIGENLSGELTRIRLKDTATSWRRRLPPTLLISFTPRPPLGETLVSIF